MNSFKAKMGPSEVLHLGILNSKSVNFLVTCEAIYSF